MVGKWVLLAAVLSVVLASSPAAPARSAGAAWSGDWATAWGPMRLSQSGAQVVGAYAGNSGHIVGTVAGSVLTGRWHASGRRAGWVVLTLKAGGRSFSGRWSSDASPGLWSSEGTGTCTSGRCLLGAPTECTKTYVIQPSGAKIAAKVKLTDLSPASVAALRKKEEAKYAGFPYNPTGAPETRKQNCAGLVMETLFPGVVKPGNIDPDQLYKKILEPYGQQVTFRRKDDVVVYVDGFGVAKHVAIVESSPVLGATKILTKDGDERPYTAELPNRFFTTLLSNDPLVQAHAGTQGRVEVWRIDRSKFKIEEVSSGQCDQPAAGAAPAPAPGTFTLVPGLTTVSNPNSNELTITPDPTGQGIDDHTGANGGAGNAGDWKVEYHWAVPTTLVAGKTAAIYLQIRVDSEDPPQPNGYQTTVYAPDFAQALPCHYPEQQACSKTFAYAVSPGQAGQPQIEVSVHMLSAEVDFFYRPAGK